MARCDRCNREEDHHGLFWSDGQHLCWGCFKADEIKNDEAVDKYYEEKGRYEDG